MSNLAQFAGYWTPPLIPDASEPAYATSGYGQNNIYIYSHNHQFLGQAVWPTGEFASSNYFNSNWNGQPSSNSNWTYAGTGFCSPHGHIHAHVVPQADTQDGHAFYLTTTSGDNPNRYYGTITSQSTGVWVNKTKRDNLCILYTNNGSDYGSHVYEMAIATMGRGAWFNSITSTMAFCGVGSGIANGYTNNRSYGLVGYNETTKMWVVIGDAQSGTSTMYVYKNINPPTLANTNDGTFWNQFNHSTKITVSFTFPSVSDTHDYQHYKIFPLDNGNIAFVYKYANNSIGYYIFTGNNGVDSTSWTFGSLIDNAGTTTSYHDSNWTVQDALPVMVTYDGKYVLVFTQYYYYLSGACGFFIRVSDGARMKFQWTDSSEGGSFAPVGANTFLYGRGVNSDGGAGQYTYQYDLDYLFRRYSSGQDVTSVFNQLRIEEPYTSTNYGMIWPMISYTPNFIRGVF